MPGSNSRRRVIQRASPPETLPSNALAFSWSASAALAIHAFVLLSGPLAGGADLVPHLRLVQRMAELPALDNVYPPAFHALAALLGSALDHELAVKALALASVACLLFGFRRLQVAAELPELSATLYAWAPYGFALSWCLPKIEAAGYGLAFFALAWLWEGRHVRLGAALAATFWVHTGAALFLGLAGGVVALARRDGRGLAALALGCIGAAPLVGMHLAADCSLAEALLFSAGDYLRSADGWSSLDAWPRLLVLSGPIAGVCALLGAGALWRGHRSAALLSLAILVLCTNELWLAPFGTRTTLNLLRGLTLFAVPVATAAGVFLASRPRAAIAVVASVAVWAIASSWLVLPGSCHREEVDWQRVGNTEVDRCTFRWVIREPRSTGRPPAP